LAKELLTKQETTSRHQCLKRCSKEP